MNWFEIWLGISPDGGSGSTEALYAGVAVVIAAAVAYRLLRRRARV